MIASKPFASPRLDNGLLEHIDLVNRSVTVVFNKRPLTFDVPLTCEVLLNGERVKLRMLQPRDRVSITYRRHQELLTAQSIEVSTRSGHHSSET